MGVLNLDDFSSAVERPDAAFERAAGERRRRLSPSAGAFGRLEELGGWLAAAQGQCPPRPLDRARVVLFAGDHGVARLGVSAHGEGETVRLVHEVLDGEAAVNVLARRFGARVRVVDVSVDCPPGEFPTEVSRHKVRRGAGRVDIEDALTPEETERAFLAGAAVADEEADDGTDLVLLGDIGVGGTTVAGILVAALAGTDAAAVTGRGSGIDDLAWMRKCAAIRDALRRARPVLGDQLRLLATSGGADFAAMTGFLLQCAVRRTPVVLDGVVSAACALVAQRIAFRAPDWWRVGPSTGEPAQAKALERLALEPLVDHGVRLGGATGALLALPLLQAAAGLLAELPPRPARREDTGSGPHQAAGREGPAREREEGTEPYGGKAGPAGPRADTVPEDGGAATAAHDDALARSEAAPGRSPAGRQAPRADQEGAVPGEPR